MTTTLVTKSINLYFKTMNNEVEIEELDKNMREAKRIGKA